MSAATVAPLRNRKGVNKTRHVPALDGLRAVAVVMVILFHLDLPGFGSGFLGVDVFFVLSGFLITSLLAGESDRSGHISFGHFWSRRIRRLMPAIAVVLVVTSFVTARNSTRSEKESIKGDLLSTTFYVANWHFAGASDYFNDEGTKSPLEHAWSLGIEEQFYFIWPISLAALLLIGRRWSGVPAVGTAALAAISAGLLAAYWAPDAVERAYMGTDSRIFEPLIGALAALLMRRTAVRDLLARHAAAIEAVAVVCMGFATAVVLRSPNSYYKGAALFLSVATAMLVAALWSGSGSVVERFLELRPVVWVGALSYGLYLWHWPFVVWLDAGYARDDALVRSAAAVLLTVGVSAVSYYMIERPIRSSRSTPRLPVRRVLLGAPVMLAAVAGIALLATRTAAPAAGVPVVVMVGDSVPLHLTPYLERAAEDRGWAVFSAARGGCPATGDHVVHPGGATLASGDKCPDLVLPLQESIVERYRPAVVIRWDRFSLADWLAADGHQVRAGTPEYWSLRRKSLGADVARLGKYGAVVALLATEPPGVGVESECTPESCNDWLRRLVDHYDDLTSRWNDVMADFAASHEGVEYISITDTVCHRDEAPCDDRIDGEPARPDGRHYEGAGAALAANAILDEIDPLMP